GPDKVRVVGRGEALGVGAEARRRLLAGPRVQTLEHHLGAVGVAAGEHDAAVVADLPDPGVAGKLPRVPLPFHDGPLQPRVKAISITKSNHRVTPEEPPFADGGPDRPGAPGGPVRGPRPPDTQGSPRRRPYRAKAVQRRKDRHPRWGCRSGKVVAWRAGSDRDLELGDLAALRLDLDDLGDAAARDDPDGPRARSGEEQEDALVGDDDLAGELTGLVERPRVGRAAPAGHHALDDGLGRQVDT